MKAGSNFHYSLGVIVEFDRSCPWVLIGIHDAPQLTTRRLPPAVDPTLLRQSVSVLETQANLHHGLILLGSRVVADFIASSDRQRCHRQTPNRLGRPNIVADGPISALTSIVHSHRIQRTAFGYHGDDTRSTGYLFDSRVGSHHIVVVAADIYPRPIVQQRKLFGDFPGFFCFRYIAQAPRCPSDQIRNHASDRCGVAGVAVPVDPSLQQPGHAIQPQEGNEIVGSPHDSKCSLRIQKGADAPSNTGVSYVVVWVDQDGPRRGGRGKPFE
mmetsp:Transcript_26322/g.72338  ORF Transcript_26322/g.72338 Transcript_26322/m.72338 type:complete len:270 (-) Transcript_26322:325-1134(-)